ncbi:MAG: methyltransferase [Gammaproteobacteria bacterium]
MKPIICITLGLLIFVPNTMAAAGITDLLDAAIQGEHRDEANKTRDIYRHPRETLLFFGLQPDMHVLEITPGGGWYTEILAPVLKDKGQLTVASFGLDNPVAYFANIEQKFITRLEASPEIYAEVERVNFKDNDYLSAVADDSVDMVVTFRNTHNWLRQGEADKVYSAMQRVLKPCGTLGVVQHRAAEDDSITIENGYVPESVVIALVENNGFKLTDTSDINANPKDSRDHPEGVWTLPPNLRMGDQDREKYLAIGESDRMTLRFIKPGDGCPVR